MADAPGSLTGRREPGSKGPGFFVPGRTYECERGDTVRFRATFTRSDRDPHFAFGSRPKAL